MEFEKKTDFKKPILVDNRNFRKINPNINEYFDSVEKELNDLPKKDGVVVDEKIIENINCPICDYDVSRQIFVKSGFIFSECKQCLHVYIQNRFQENVLLEKYSSSVIDKIQRKVTSSSPDHLNYWNQVYKKYMDYFNTLKITNNNLLDVGSGSGAFLKFCNKHTNYNLYGNDFCDYNHDEIIKIIGDTNYYYKQKLEDINFKDQKFGIMTFWGVLEHITNPVAILKKCYDILDVNGYVLLLVPNIYSRAFKIFGINNPTLNPRAHINFYTKSSIEFLCEMTNFKILDLFQELPVIDLMYPFVSFNDELIDGILENEESYYYVYVLKKK